MQVTHDKSVDGRNLIRVSFERQSPEAATPTIEVVYELRFPQDFRLADETRVLAFISATRTDTREVVQLATEETEMALERASAFAASLTRDW